MANMSRRSLAFFMSIVITLALAPRSNGLNQSQALPSSSDATYTKLTYHGGALLVGQRSINVYLVWYGAFSRKDTTSINNFFVSINPYKQPGPQHIPTVSTWWKTIFSYKDKAGNPIPSTVKLVKQIGDIYSLGKILKRAQIAAYVINKIATRTFPIDSNGIYLVLTAKDVNVERFCMSSCGFHDHIMVAGKSGRIVYAHVGEPSRQCPGLCAWPYAVPAYGPPGQALVAPNSVGVDGMIINIATVLAGAVTNPFRTGYFQGDALAPLEAVTACPGIFGPGAYPGYPGDLTVDEVSKASYNAYGAASSKFLLPAVWDPVSFDCKIVA